MRCVNSEKDNPLYYKSPAMITAVDTPGWHKSPRHKGHPTACASSSRPSALCYACGLGLSVGPSL